MKDQIKESKQIKVTYVGSDGYEIKDYPLRFLSEEGVINHLPTTMKDARDKGAVRLIIESDWCASFDIAL